MTQDILRNAAAVALSPGGGLAAGTVPGAAIERLLLAVLPQGWSVIGRCRFGTAPPGPGATGCHALAHPETGIALIDIAPDATPNAESRLRRALSGADFWSDFPGCLPVWHGRMEGPAIRGLARIVQDRFSTLPPLTVPGGQDWIGAVRQALAQDPAWEVPGQSEHPAAPFLPPEPEEAEEEPRRGRPYGLLLLGFLGTFVLGLTAGFLLLPPAEAPEQAALADPPPVAGPTAEPPSVDDQEPPPAISAAAADPAPSPLPEPAADPESAAMAAAPLPTEPGPDNPAAAGIPPAMPGSEEPPAPAEAANEPDLPPAPPPEPPPPAPHRTAAPGRSGRTLSGIDRACILALFRFQQGEALSAAEHAYLRNGCATRR